MKIDIYFFLSLFCTVILFSGCDKSRVYEEYNNLPENLGVLKMFKNLSSQSMIQTRSIIFYIM